MWRSLAYALFGDMAVICFILALLEYSHWLLVITHAVSLRAAEFSCGGVHSREMRQSCS